MKYIKLILPAILCVIIIHITKMEIYYYPLSFGIIIGLINWEKHKYNPYIGTLLSIFVSFVSFWIAFFSMSIFGIFRDFILQNTEYTISKDLVGELSYIISPFLFAPILVFIIYKFVFNFSKTKFAKYIIIVSIILLVLQSSFFYNNEEFLKDSIQIPFVIWQVIMALAIQLIINQDIFKKKV